MAPPPGRSEVWYMVYKDEIGQTHTVKGATEGIRKALKDSLLGDAVTILVGRSKTGQFVPIGSVPEFRDLVVAPAPASGTGRLPDARRTPPVVGSNSPPRSGPPVIRRPQVTIPAAGPNYDSHAETKDYGSVSPTPPPTVLPPRDPVSKPKELAASSDAKKEFNWTPALLFAIALLSALFGCFLFSK
jgi:hypothetical protein